MIDERTGKNLKEYLILKDPELYIYIMLNDNGKIKIGKTKNIQQRYQSLCGSNGQGIQIIKLYCSQNTYLFTLENIMHEKFDKYRIPNTEWFFDKKDFTGKTLFNKAVNELESIFSSESYKRCNEVRKEFNLSK